MQTLQDLAAGWISKCHDSHASCSLGKVRPSAGSKTQPSRVVELLPLDRARLFITKEPPINSHSKSYTALSHCWGAGAPHVITEKANLEQMTQELPMKELPKTYLDAFQITRCLGVRYIWIDALCIVQDDPYDWQVESAKMCDIYRDAYCTIAASAAERNGQGCFVEKYELDLSTESCHLVNEENDNRSEIVLLPPAPLWENQILSSPLNSRAWVLQERLLSPRILHFAKDAIFWECSELRSSHFEPNGILDVELLRDPVSYSYSLRNLTSTESARSPWLQLIQNYTKLGITKIEDRLPALSGLAKMIQSKTADTYVTGLWRSSMVEGLAWSLSGKDFKSEELYETRPYTAPSWSWASTDRGVGFLTEVDPFRAGSVEHSVEREWRPDVEILNVSIELAGSDPTGRVSGGSITLSGYVDILPVITTRALPVGSTESIDPGDLERRLQPGVEVKGSANLIHLDYPKDPSIASFPALRLCHRSPKDQAQTCLLVLEETGKAPDQYRRIGRAVLYGLAPVTELHMRVIDLI